MNRIIPNPITIISGNGYCSFDRFILEFDDEFEKYHKPFNDLLEKIIENQTQPSKSVKVKCIYEPTLATEEYILTVEKHLISVQCFDGAGFFYAIQTLRQCISKNAEGLLTFPIMVVKDKPRFKWRGLHLDVCRHFFRIDEIKRVLDLMGMYKLNRFHWHLTEDQGWRIEIKKYPLLTEKSAWRTEKDGSRYGGFYTQDEIKEVVAYAAERFISVVPEIELPGHAQAALSAYPQYSCTGGPFEVWNDWGVSDEVYCAGKDSTFEFLNDIINEVCTLFPSEYFHIGGDECPKTRWHECPDCRKRMKQEGLSNEEELQSWFIRRIEKTLLQQGKILIGWDEILEGGLAESAVVMSWRGTEGGIKAVKRGNKAIMTPWASMYFDKRPYEEDKKVNLPILTWEDVYNYDPLPQELNEAEQKLIIGAQANVWTEHIHTEEELEYMLIPRLFPLSEILWASPERKDIESFRWLLKRHMEFLIQKGYNFAKYREEILNK
ncbi:MAG: beta-N-acetylhexosaminidase [Candidatus Cloacimonetes bacterium]|nr:beta-N-acetylhexosaminidase [Candidatus Cloacimonadota bacterium]